MSWCPKEAQNANLFDSIARRYDIFNRIASFNLDIYWRRKSVLSLKSLKHIDVLDVACGTGDLLLALFECKCDIYKARGIDTSAKMLERAEAKIKGRGLGGKIELLRQDTIDMSFPDFTFDVVTCAFGVRNFAEPLLCLKQMMRVLKPGGRLLILEFSLPQNPILKNLYLIYLKYGIPLLGKIITGNFSAYSYLGRTIRTFPSGKDFCRLLEDAGFMNISAVPLTFGVVNLYSAQKRQT